jgi:hypothetical protein
MPPVTPSGLEKYIHCLGFREIAATKLVLMSTVSWKELGIDR